MDISVIIPIRDERDNLQPLHHRLTHTLDLLNLDYEIIWVDDGSQDGSFQKMEELADQDFHLKIIRLSRNFGQAAALQAGIDHAQGEVIVTMDGDLQNDPFDIPVLLEKLQEGYDAVFGWRVHRQDGLILRKIPSQLANWMIRRFTGSPILDMGCTLRVMTRELAKSLALYGEMHRFIPVLIMQTGAKVTQVPVHHQPRTRGKTKYSVFRAPKVFLDLITIKFWQNYLTRPMHVMGTFGLGALGLGFLCLLGMLGIHCFSESPSGLQNPLLILSGLFFLGGMQFLSLGLLGEMITRNYFEGQGKRIYKTRELINWTEKEKNSEMARIAG